MTKKAFMAFLSYLKHILLTFFLLANVLRWGHTGMSAKDRTKILRRRKATACR